MTLNPFQMKTFLPFAFMFCLLTSLSFGQSIQSINPTSAAQGSTLGVTITGLGTAFTNGTSTNVWLMQGSNTLQVTGEVAISGTEIQGTLSVPASAPPGFYNVHVNDVPSPLINGFEVTAPSTGSIASIAPNVGPPGGFLTVTITGMGTAFNTGSSTGIQLTQGSNTIVGTNVVAVSPTLLTADINIPSSAPLGLYDVRVNGVSMPLADGFEVKLLDVGLDELQANTELSIYPNPASSSSRIKYDLTIATDVSFEIIDITGRNCGVYNQGLQQIGEHELPLPAKQLSHAGLYFLRMTTDQGNTVSRFYFQPQ